MMKKRWIILGIFIVGLGIYWYFSPSSPQTHDQSILTTTTPNPTPAQIQTEQQEKQQLQQWVHQFLSQYMQYDPKNPLAHIEKVKSMMTEEVYETQKNIYRVPLPNLTSRNLQSCGSIEMERTLQTQDTFITVPCKVKINQNQIHSMTFYLTITSDGKVGWIEYDTDESES